MTIEVFWSESPTKSISHYTITIIISGLLIPESAFVSILKYYTVLPKNRF